MAATQSKPKNAPKSSVRSLRKDTEPVYFAARGIGNFVFESPDYEYIALGDGTNDRRKKPAVELVFPDDRGVTDPLDPTNPKHKPLIDRARAHIAGVQAGDIEDERVSRFGLRELVADAPQPPVSTWDTTDAAKLPMIVETLGLDVEKCIRYEEHHQARPALLDALEMLLAQPESDPLESVEL